MTNEPSIVRACFPYFAGVDVDESLLYLECAVRAWLQQEAVGTRGVPLHGMPVPY